MFQMYQIPTCTDAMGFEEVEPVATEPKGNSVNCAQTSLQAANTAQPDNTNLQPSVTVKSEVIS